jgi:hypothetical protein
MRNINQKNPERGAIIVEFALVLPLLLVLLFGIIEFGLLFYNKQVLTNACREGARAGIAQSVDSEITSIVEGYCQNRLINFYNVPEVPPPTIAIVDGKPREYPNDLSVKIDYEYTFLVPELLGFGTSIILSVESVMRMEKVSSH